MTDNAIRRFGHLEPTAREYCRLRGYDPDELVSHGPAEFSDSEPGFYTAEIRHTPRWLFIARGIAASQERVETDQIINTVLRSHPPEPVSE